MFSIIIMTRNEATKIGRMLDSIVQENFKGKYEVLVVDANSQDGTCEIVSSYTNRLPIRLVNGLGQGIAADRNFGAENSKGNLLFFTEGDCYLKPGLLDKIQHCFNDKDLMVWSSITIPNSSIWYITLTYKIYDVCRFLLSKLPYPIRGYSISAAIIAIRHSLFLELGGFQEGGIMNDDGNLGRRIRNYCKNNARAYFIFSINEEFTVYRSTRRFEKSYFEALNHYVYVLVNFFPFLGPLLRNKMLIEGMKFKNEN